MRVEMRRHVDIAQHSNANNRFSLPLEDKPVVLNFSCSLRINALIAVNKERNHDSSRRLCPRPEDLAALEKGMEIAKRRKEHLVMVSAGPGGS